MQSLTFYNITTTVFLGTLKTNSKNGLLLLQCLKYISSIFTSEFFCRWRGACDFKTRTLIFIEAVLILQFNVTLCLSKQYEHMKTV